MIDILKLKYKHQQFKKKKLGTRLKDVLLSLLMVPVDIFRAFNCSIGLHKFHWVNSPGLGDRLGYNDQEHCPYKVRKCEHCRMERWTNYDDKPVDDPREPPWTEKPEMFPTWSPYNK